MPVSHETPTPLTPLMLATVMNVENLSRLLAASTSARAASDAGGGNRNGSDPTSGVPVPVSPAVGNFLTPRSPRELGDFQFISQYNQFFQLHRHLKQNSSIWKPPSAALDGSHKRQREPEDLVGHEEPDIDVENDDLKPVPPVRSSQEFPLALLHKQPRSEPPEWMARSSNLLSACSTKRRRMSSDQPSPGFSYHGSTDHRMARILSDRNEFVKRSPSDYASQSDSDSAQGSHNRCWVTDSPTLGPGSSPNGEKGDSAVQEGAEQRRAEQRRREPKCQKCKNHGLINKVERHKKDCKYKDCQCMQCQTTAARQKAMKMQQRDRRAPPSVSRIESDNGTILFQHPHRRNYFRDLDRELRKICSNPVLQSSEGTMSETAKAIVYCLRKHSRSSREVIQRIETYKELLESTSFRMPLDTRQALPTSTSAPSRAAISPSSTPSAPPPVAPKSPSPTLHPPSSPSSEISSSPPPPAAMAAPPILPLPINTSAATATTPFPIHQPALLPRIPLSPYPHPLQDLGVFLRFHSQHAAAASSMVPGLRPPHAPTVVDFRNFLARSLGFSQHPPPPHAMEEFFRYFPIQAPRPMPPVDLSDTHNTSGGESTQPDSPHSDSSSQEAEEEPATAD